MRVSPDTSEIAAYEHTQYVGCTIVLAGSGIWFTFFLVLSWNFDLPNWFLSPSPRKQQLLDFDIGVSGHVENAKFHPLELFLFKPILYKSDELPPHVCRQ